MFRSTCLLGVAPTSSGASARRALLRALVPAEVTQWSEGNYSWLMATLSVERVFVLYFPLQHRFLHRPNVTIALLCTLLLYAFVAARAARLSGGRCTPISCTNVGRGCHIMPINMSWFEIFLLIIYALSCHFQYAILVAFGFVSCSIWCLRNATI